jgi:HK97 family phage portal protein
MSVVRGGDGFTLNISVSDVIGSGNYNRKNVKGTVVFQRDNLTNLYQARGFSTRENSAVRGQSLLGIAADDIRQQILGHKHNNNMLEKGGRLSLVFNIKNTLQDEDFQTVKKRIFDQFGGTTGAQIGVVDAEDMELKEFGTTNKDMDFVNLRMLSKESIYGIYKVPLEFANQGSSTFNNKSEAKLALYDDAVLPLTKKIYGNLSRMLISRYGLDPNVFRLGIDEDSIEALQTRRLDQLKKRKDLNVETDNEIRAFIGRERLSEGADSLYKPATMLPVASDEDLSNPRVLEDDDTDSAS